MDRKRCARAFPCVLFILLLCISCTRGFVGSSVKINTPQATIESIFHTIRENDTTAFRTMLATETDYETFFYISNMKVKEDSAQVCSYVREQFNKSNAELFIRQFNKVRIDGMANGIKWKETTFVRAFFDDTSQDDKEPIQVMYPKAEFAYDEYVGVITVGYHLIKAERGWVVASLPWMEFKKMVWMPT